MLVGLVSQLIPLSVVGFVLVVGALGFLVQTVRGRNSSTLPDAAEAAARPTKQQPGGTACAAAWRTGSSAGSTKASREGQ